MGWQLSPRFDAGRYCVGTEWVSLSSHVPYDKMCIWLSTSDIFVGGYRLLLFNLIQITLIFWLSRRPVYGHSETKHYCPDKLRLDTDTIV